MAGDNKVLFVDQYGVIRTLPGQLVQPGLKLDTSGGAAAPLLDATQGGQLVAPGSFYQTQRLLGLQQAEDERSKAQRLAEDQYKITDQMNVVRDIDYWKSDNAERYFSNLEFSISTSNDKLEIDDSNNVLAVKSGSATINVVFDGVKSSKTINVKKNNVNNIDLSIAEKPEKIRTGDVINLKADAYDKRGNLVNDVNI